MATKGICTLCGRGAKLTFEHVPAKVTGNNHEVIMHNVEEWLARDRDTRDLPGGIKQLEGMGLRALCDGCNNGLLNQHYVAPFREFVDAGKQMLSACAPRLEEFNARQVATCVSVRFLEVNRLAVAKQIVAMVLVTCGRDVVEKNPALEAFVRQPTLRGLPAQYRLFIALTPGPAAKTTGLSAIVDTDTAASRVVAEVVFPPFAYALSFDGTAVYAPGEITDWCSGNYGEVAEVAMDLRLGFCHTIFPGDLRSEAQIARTRAENLNQQP
jgi:hypothetical protein